MVAFSSGKFNSVGTTGYFIGKKFQVQSLRPQSVNDNIPQQDKLNKTIKFLEKIQECVYNVNVEKDFLTKTQKSAVIKKK